MPQWKLVRLELAPTSQFSHGSASRAYLLRIPLDNDGFIDEAVLAQAPNMATVRRFWPNEADQRGLLVRRDGGWALACALNGDDPNFCQLGVEPIRLGECITLTMPDGSDSLFRVVQMKADSAGAK